MVRWPCSHFFRILLSFLKSTQAIVLNHGIRCRTTSWDGRCENLACLAMLPQGGRRPRPGTRGRTMAEYRAYILDEDGHFLRAIELVCLDDDAAKEHAKQLVDGHDIELWRQERRIA